MADDPASGRDGSRRSPLHAHHLGLGATMVPFAGWSMPLRYQSELVEHHAVRQAAGLFDLSHMGEVHCVGRQVAEALDFALVGAISALALGQARYTMLCAPDGGVLDDLVVYRLAEQHFLVVANAANTALVRASLAERFDRFDATVRDASIETALIALQGPVAATVLAPLAGADLSALGNYRCVPATVLDHEVLLARTGYTGEDGFELFVRAEQAPPLFEALALRGAAHGVVPAGLAARDSLRLEAGMPLYGHELSTARSPYAAGLGRVVRLDKPGDFVGRGALSERQHETGERLVGLSCPRPPSPRAEMAVQASAEGDSGEPVGIVTSGAPSPTLGHPIAMAYVRTECAAVGTSLAVAARGRAIPVEVVPLPFYRRERPATPPRAADAEKEL
ncbi:MAG: glycine cleavage system aminomethyltransferase GcvT [Actinomycetota bacterium]|nr:glycine cleavage system aminomethyltransferase GcvT [Actinomycetota bacterium]